MWASWLAPVTGIAAVAVALAACSPQGTSGSEEQVVRGAQLYEANCAACHGGATGGDIADIPPPHNTEGHTWHHPDCLLLELVQDGMPRRPGLPEDTPTMPSFEDELSQQDIRAILTLIKTWWSEDQLESQEQLTDQTCD